MTASIVIDQHAWAAWHPQDLATRIGGIAAPWCVVGGWALDVWHGVETRVHEDLEFTILRSDLPLFREALGGLAIFTAHDGAVAPLPTGLDPPTDVSQLWCWDRAASSWRVDMMLECGSRETWVYKRDPRLTCPRNAIVAETADGIPYLRPAAVLLFKAKYQRPKDEIDFQNALPKLTTAERIRLGTWLETTHPGHDWLAALG